MDDEVFYIKKFNNLSLDYILKDIARPQRAVRALWTYSMLQKKGIPAAKMYFALVDTSRIINNPNLVVSKECKGNTVLEILCKDISDKEKYLLFDELIMLISKLFASGVYHHDPNLTNFIKAENGLTLVDIDDVYIFPKITRKLFNHIMTRLNKILLLAQIRPKNVNINLNLSDRKYILKKIMKNYDKNINWPQFFQYLENKSQLKSFEITAFLNKVSFSQKTKPFLNKQNQQTSILKTSESPI